MYANVSHTYTCSAHYPKKQQMMLTCGRHKNVEKQFYFIFFCCLNKWNSWSMKFSGWFFWCVCVITFTNECYNVGKFKFWKHSNSKVPVLYYEKKDAHTNSMCACNINGLEIRCRILNPQNVYMSWYIEQKSLHSKAHHFAQEFFPRTNDGT